MNNETVKELPDKAVVALDKYLDELLNDKTEEDEQEQEQDKSR